MIRLFSTRKRKKRSVISFYISTILVMICVVAWAGLSIIHANEDDAADNMDNDVFSFQNAAQSQHANNVATQAALQDPDVAAAIANAKQSLDPNDIQNAKNLFNEKVGAFSEQIAEMRSSGRGWGEIAKHLGVHPSILGLGHAKHIQKQNVYFATHSRMKSEIKAATARSFTGDHAKGHGIAGSAAKSKSLGFAFAKGRGHNRGRGLALGHSKAKDGLTGIGHSVGHGAGKGAGHGNGHGVGHGAGHGGGHGGGNGGGHGGGHGGGNGNGHK